MEGTCAVETVKGTDKRGPADRKKPKVDEQFFSLPKEAMLPEVQEIVAKGTFTGAPQLREWRSSGLLSAPGGVMHCNWELEAYMTKAACVNKMWNKAYQKYLASQTSEIFQRVREDAVKSALDLCDYSKYDEYKPLPNHAQMLHYVYAGRKLLFVLRFRRTLAERVHELHAFYGVKDRFSALTIPVSPICCVADRNRDLWQKEFFRAWRAEKAAGLDQWLGEQHVEFHVEVVEGQ